MGDFLLLGLISFSPFNDFFGGDRNSKNTYLPKDLYREQLEGETDG